MPKASNTPPVEGISIEQLVKKRLDRKDPWRLALVQRHLVWDAVRMARLLDSLLGGYPIGSILVCRVQQDAHGLQHVQHGKGGRKAVALQQGAWQLIDGQQRINALTTIFNGDPQFGRFLVDMTALREHDDIVTRRRDKRASTKYIVLLDATLGPQVLEERSNYLDLSGWCAWAEEQTRPKLQQLAARAARERRLPTRALRALDPQFSPPADPERAKRAADRFAALVRAWTEETIPLQRLSLEGPKDVLQVFSRVNLEGVALSADDVFFAAVKTIWHPAEEHLQRVATQVGLVDRFTALRLLARLASMSLGAGDLMPLRVDRLNGQKGKELIRRMMEIAKAESAALRRVGIISKWLTKASVLGHGLRLVHRTLLDPVLAWAAVNEQLDTQPDARRWLPAIESFLLGAQAYRWPTVLRDAFATLAFRHALQSGIAGASFPTMDIVRATHRQWPGLTVARRSVRASGSPADQVQLATENAGLFLAISQQLPFRQPLRVPADGRRQRRLEWDHIFPQALADRMKFKGANGAYSHHAYRSLVWSAGNLWALDAELNNRASDMWPSEKFELLDSKAGTNGLPTRWPDAAHAFLTASERKYLLAAEIHLRADKVEEGMVEFRKYAESRSHRIYDYVAGKFPDLQNFSSSNVLAGISAVEPSPDGGKVSSAMGLAAMPAGPTRLSTEPDPRANNFASVTGEATRLGVQAELQSLIDRGQAAGLHARPHVSSVMFTPPANKTRMAFTVWPQGNPPRSFRICRSAGTFAEFFAGVKAEEVRRRLGPDGEATLSADDVGRFIAELEALMAKNSGHGSGEGSG